ncbi:MAG: dihydroorotate dehydrogenase 2, nonfunctional [Candidatus Roizmanbacteria bacterium GW2011_GWA2_33_33]|uniref:Dihydroorotate dehydrogenase (quinone) n=2 Tax=Candidatus Roizmaniibacteriota TaxID=1752723 RepID=A0A0G0DJE4_9BACT|nr:MAG: dihydroorotate dehydrogenase 2, nonfunctional [Candidatus Roizmanbacteria bacterium GW2011_GWA2_33_33]KKP63220.1 MAG: dihydroorotate dehydrogenase 2, nonfunctional [Candidatus Roizmanbacteria bacterium GW2011_GWC2_34_23]
MKKFFLLALLALSGIADAAYLTFEHYQQVIPPCTINRLLPIASDCGKVLRSSYSVMFGVPLAVFGVVQYLLLLTAIILLAVYRKKISAYWLILQSMIGAIFSLYFMYVQLVILKSICLYCTLSAIISFAIFFLVSRIFYKERFSLRLNIIAFVYQKIMKPLLFLLDPEFIHNLMVSRGELIGKTFIKNYFNWKLNYQSLKIKQKISGINFIAPIGLAAGFDYNAKLTQVLYSLGFGFQTVGTITNMSYGGNPKPRLGRLPKSRSLMVNKGFKNLGVEKISQKLSQLNYKIPLGISIGMSNNELIKNTNEAIKDTINAFKIFEKAKVKNSYYELNISCPNLINTAVDFNKPENINQLFQSIDRLKIKKTIFIKMPISISNKEFVSLLNVISKYKIIKGVIIGNLFKDRNSLLLDRREVKKFKVGYFSGKPCAPRSNELIKLAYKKYGSRLIVIGCGGVFNGQDAYEKIKLGASLIQLITGMIFQGPQLISQINLELEELLEKDGYNNIKEAIGVNNK